MARRESRATIQKRADAYWKRVRREHAVKQFENRRVKAQKILNRVCLHMSQNQVLYSVEARSVIVKAVVRVASERFEEGN